MLLLTLWVSAAAFSQTQSAIRVKCGGPRYTDSKGQVWQADADYT
jgi:hypothetical protein